MNVEIIWQGTDITNHVIEYTRQHDICTGIGSLDLIVEGKTNYDFIPWNSIIIKEEGTQVAKYNISSEEKASPNGNYIIAAQDNSKRLTDYFLDKEYTAETLSYSRYWIELILSEAGVVDYDINTDSDGEPVTIGSQFGMKPAYDAILNLLQLSGWYMYFDSTGSCQIGELDTDKTPIHDFHGNDILSIRTTNSDKMLRNRVYVWGNYEEDVGWVTAKAETYLPWFRDDGEDWRSTVYQNSSIYYYSTAIDMAEKILSEFSKQTPEKEVQVIGLHPNLQVGKYVKILGKYGTGVNQITSFIVNMNDGGATTTLILDKRCPRLFGISDTKAEYIYIGTNNDGVYRKSLDGGYWSAYNTNLETAHIRDLTANNTLLSAVTQDGKFYINDTGSWEQATLPTTIVDISNGNIIDTTVSGYFTACSHDISYPDGGLTAIFTSVSSSGFEFGNPLPVFPPSGNRAWIAGFTPEGGTRYIHQINYTDGSGIYDIGALDLSTNDLGHNLITISDSTKNKLYGDGFGSYITQGYTDAFTKAYTTNVVAGKDIYIGFPPPTQGIYIYKDDYGGYYQLTGTEVGDYISCIYTSPSGTYGRIEYLVVPFSDDRVSIQDKTLLADGTVIWNDYDIYTDKYSLFNEYIKIVRIDDDNYGVCTSPYEYFQLTKSSESITKEINYPQTRIINHQIVGIFGPPYWHESVLLAQDGNFIVFVVASAYWRSGFYQDYHGGAAFLRIINVKTGDYTDYDICPPNDIAGIPGGYGAAVGENGGYWRVEFCGADVSANYFSVSVTATMGGQGDGFKPKTMLYVFIINKYTGSIVRKELEIEYLEHYDGSSCDAKILHSGYSYTKIISEDIENETAVIMVVVFKIIRILAWCWVIGVLPPYLFYSLVDVGYSTQAFVYYLSSDGAVINENVYENVVTEKESAVPPWPLTESIGIPAWLYFPSISMGATYSRTSDSIVVWAGRRLTYDDSNLRVVFANPSNPDDYIVIDDSKLIYWDIGIDDWNLQSGFMVHKMMDVIDDTIYITIIKDGTLLGFNKNGVQTKEINETTGEWSGAYPILLGNKISTNHTLKQFINWPGPSGVYDPTNSYKLLYHNPTVLPSGQFTVLFNHTNPLAVETGLGLPTVIYDPPSGRFLHKNCTVLGASWTNSGIFPTMNPNTAITDARLLDIFAGVDFPLAPGFSLPDNSISRFLGTVDSDNNLLKIFNTEYDIYKDRYSIIHFFPIGDDVTHVDFTNFFPSPYIFTSVITLASGQLFFQRFTEDDVFYNLSYNLPVGSLITIIRADDRI